MQVSLSNQSRLPDYKNDRITVAQWVLCVMEPRGFSVLLLGAVQPTPRHKQAIAVSVTRFHPATSTHSVLWKWYNSDFFSNFVWNALLTYSSSEPDFVSWSLQKENDNNPKAQTPNLYFQSSTIYEYLLIIYEYYPRLGPKHVIVFLYPVYLVNAQ